MGNIRISIAVNPYANARFLYNQLADRRLESQQRSPSEAQIQALCARQWVVTARFRAVHGHIDEMNPKIAPMNLVLADLKFRPGRGLNSRDCFSEQIVVQRSIMVRHVSENQNQHDQRADDDAEPSQNAFPIHMCPRLVSQPEPPIL